MEDSRPRVHKSDFSWRDQQSNLTAGHRHNAPLFPNICVITGGSWFISTKSEMVRSSNPCQTTGLPFWPQLKRDLLLSPENWQGCLKLISDQLISSKLQKASSRLKSWRCLLISAQHGSSLNELHILHTSRNQCWFQYLCFTQSWGTLNIKNDLKTKNSNYQIHWAILCTHFKLGILGIVGVDLQFPIRNHCNFNFRSCLLVGQS